MLKTKRLLISPEFFTMLSNGTVEIIASPVPPTAKIIEMGVVTEQEQQYFYLILGDLSFEYRNGSDPIEDLPSPHFRRIEK